MYQVKRPSRSVHVPVRGLQYHVRCWGEAHPGVAPLVLLHGWMDVAASFQFVVDAFSDAFLQRRLVLAPDWRGYGDTDGGGVDNYWWPDYIADLDCLAEHFSPDAPIDLVGHSLGGNVAMFYAGIRPARVRRLVNLEGFGGAPTSPDQAPGRYAKWLEQLRQFQRGEITVRAYETSAGVAHRLTKNNPRLARDQAGRDKADWLALHWSRQNAQGKWEILGDPAHKLVNAQLLRVDELREVYRRISMPLLAVEASDSVMWKIWKDSFTPEMYHERLALVSDCRVAHIQDAGHMLHHDQPERLAALMEPFLAP